MHDHKKCLAFLWGKLTGGTLLEWLEENKLCGLHMTSCMVAGYTAPFCPNEPVPTPDDDEDTVPPVIGQLDPSLSSDELSMIAQLDIELCGTEPSEQSFAQLPTTEVASETPAGIDPEAIAAILRIAQFVFELWKNRRS